MTGMNSIYMVFWNFVDRDMGILRFLQLGGGGNESFVPLNFAPVHVFLIPHCCALIHLFSLVSC